MPQVGVKYAGQNLSWEEARQRSEDPDFPYPPPLIEAMADQRNDGIPSASTVVGCLRRFELQRTTDYYGEASGELPPLFGTAFHEYMDKYRQRLIKPGELTETSLTTIVNTEAGEILFGGRFDFFAPGKLISDWKSKRNIPQGFTPPNEHIGQVNIYNWLASTAGYEPAPTWELAYVSQGWVQRFQRDTLPVERIGRYVRKRLDEWGTAKAQGKLPAPVPQLFELDAKGQQAAPCRYCPVREACLAALKIEEERPF